MSQSITIEHEDEVSPSPRLQVGSFFFLNKPLHILWFTLFLSSGVVGSGLDWCALPCLPPDIPASPGERKTIATERVSKGYMRNQEQTND